MVFRFFVCYLILFLVITNIHIQPSPIDRSYDKILNAPLLQSLMKIHEKYLE